MSQPNPSIPFDFAAAVAQARALYPAQTACVTFIDKTAPDAALQFERFLARTAPVYRTIMVGKYRALADYTAEVLDDNGSFAEIDPITGYGVVMLGHADADYVTGVSADQMRHHVFMHELGHIVVPNGMYRDIDGLRLWSRCDNYWDSVAQTHEWESAADTFSFLHNLKSGAFGIAQINALTIYDAWRFFEYPRSASALEHMTMPASDAFITLAGQLDLASLTPDDITAIAQNHARTHAFAPWQAGALYKSIDAVHGRWGSRLSRIFNAHKNADDHNLAAPFIKRLHGGLADGLIDSEAATSRHKIARAARRIA